MKNRFLLLCAALCGLFGAAKAQHQWVPQMSGTSAYLNCLAIVSADTVYVSAETGAVLKTVNGGNTWNQVGTGPISAMVFTTNLKGFGACSGEIIATQNGGATWSSCYSNPNISEFWDIYFPDENNGYAAAWSVELANYVVKTSDAGATWDTLYKYDENFALFNTIYFRDALNGFVGCDNGILLKTTNGGTNFTPISVFTNSAINTIFFPTADTGYLATDNSIFSTINGGDNWSQLSFSFPGIIYSIHFINANRGFAVGGTGMGSMSLYETSNAGNTWTQSATGTQTLSAVAFADTMPGYAVGSNGIILKYSKASGIEDSETPINISISPNPAVDFIEITSDKEIFYEIYSAEGALINTGVLKSGSSKMALNGYSGGLYIVKYKTDKGIGNNKFIKL